MVVDRAEQGSKGGELIQFLNGLMALSTVELLTHPDVVNMYQLATPFKTNNVVDNQRTQFLACRAYRSGI